MHKILIVILLMLVSGIGLAVEIDIKSVRVTLSKPDTSHSLIYKDSGNLGSKTLFNLSPINNERLGVFVDINGIELGYAVDVFDNNIETKTQNFLVSYRKFKHSKITLNYQTLEGFQSDTENLTGPGFSSRFDESTKSSKIELFGLHNLHTFNNKTSLFSHFFLNKPHLSDKFDWSLGIVAGWSIKRLSLENTQSIVVQAPFNVSPVPVLTSLKSDSFSANAGPFLSINLPHNINFFAEYKFGKGYINNRNERLGFKQSGDEKAKAFGAGLSWTANDQKTLVLLRAWDQKGRHVDTAFGDLSVVYFF